MIGLLGAIVSGVIIGILVFVISGVCTIALYKAVISLADVENVDMASRSADSQASDDPWGKLLRNGVRGNPVSKNNIVCMIASGPFGLLGMIWTTGWVALCTVGGFVGYLAEHIGEIGNKLAAQIGTGIARKLGVPLEEDAPAAALPPVTHPQPEDTEHRCPNCKVGNNLGHVFANSELTLTLSAAKDVLNAVPRDTTQTPPCASRSRLRRDVDLDEPNDSSDDFDLAGH